MILKDIVPGVLRSELHRVGNQFFFLVAYSRNCDGPGLWVSDGTPEGTMAFSDLLHQPPNWTDCEDYWPGAWPWPALFKKSLIFPAYDGLHGMELWTSDMTPAGTRLWKDINIQGLMPSELVTVGNRLLFTANADRYARGYLWASDGSTNGTRLLLDNRANMLVNYASPSAPLGDRLLFRKGLDKFSLWSTDGTKEGTFPIEVELSYPFGLAAGLGKVFFASMDNNFESGALWISNGTTEGTRILANPGFRFPNLPSQPKLDFAVLGERVYFTTESSLWVSDGTPEGTRPWLELGTAPYALVTVKDTLYFGLEGDVWASDGTSEGTAPRISDILVDSERLLTLGDLLFFRGQDKTTGKRGIWLSNGDREGTVMLLETCQDCSGERPLRAAGVRDHFFFPAVDVTGKPGLWFSNGTVEGTQVLKHITVPGSASLDRVQESLVFVDGRLFFAAENAYGIGLWTSDGTPEGTIPILDPAGVNDLQLLGPTCVFGELGCESWIENPWLRVVGNLLFFPAIDGEHGPGLWVLPLDNLHHQPFHRADPNSSGATDISDGIAIFGFLFLGNPATLSCKESADTNNDGKIDISDGIYLLNWLFVGGPEPVAPGPTGAPCGFDPDTPGSPGDLGCKAYSCK